MPFAIMPLLSANVGLPALQGSMSRAVAEARQGELQGTLSSIANLAGVIGPILATLVFAVTLQTLPGAVWYAGALGYLACAMLAGWHLRRIRRARDVPPASRPTASAGSRGRYPATKSTSPNL